MRYRLLSSIIIAISTFDPAATELGATPRRFSAALGLQIFNGGEGRAARTADRARPGNRIAVYARPTREGFVYIVETNADQARLLHRAPIRKNARLRFPSRKHPLKSGVWSYHIVLAPQKVPALDQLFRKGSANATDWGRVANDLRQRSRIDLTDNTHKPIPLAASARGLGAENDQAAARDPFFRRLKTYSGRGLLFRSYTIDVS